MRPWPRSHASLCWTRACLRRSMAHISSNPKPASHRSGLPCRISSLSIHVAPSWVTCLSRPPGDSSSGCGPGPCLFRSARSEICHSPGWTSVASPSFSKGGGFQRVGLVRGRGYRLAALVRKLGDSSRVNVPKAPRLVEISGGFVARLGIRIVPGRPRLPGLDHLALRAIRLNIGDRFGIGVQADPDGFAWFYTPVPARDAAAEVVETASFRATHGRGIPTCAADCVEKCAAYQADQTPQSPQKTSNSA